MRWYHYLEAVVGAIVAFITLAVWNHNGKLREIEATIRSVDQRLSDLHTDIREIRKHVLSE